MSTKARNKEENRNDERSKGIDSNPCPTCSALRLPICKGHGGGGGGAEAEDENPKNDNAPIPKYKSTNIEIEALSAYLEMSEVWNSENDFLYNFNNNLAAFSIVLDLARGLIHFKANEFLSANNKKDLNELYNKIEDKLKKFIDEVNAKNSSISREGNNLKINIQDHNFYDQFVTRLLNKNLIPNNNYNADLAYQVNQNAEQMIDEKEAATFYKSSR